MVRASARIRFWRRSALVAWVRSIAPATRSSGATSPESSSQRFRPRPRLARALQARSPGARVAHHRNIGAIYGLEEADGIQALVLELVEGPTLADRIGRVRSRPRMPSRLRDRLRRPSRRHTITGSSTAISSRPTSSCGPTARSRSSTSAWRNRSTRDPISGAPTASPTITSPALTRWA